MNMKSLSVVLGAFTVLALGACKVTTSGTSGTGGSSTTSGEGTTTTGGVGGGGGSGGAASTATGTGGAPACDPKYTCAEAITPPADATKLCPGAHADLYDALTACTCTGACKTACADNVCASKDIAAACTTCLQAAAPDGCKTEFDACSNDL
jgi:hypothetical protein